MLGRIYHLPTRAQDASTIHVDAVDDYRHVSIIVNNMTIVAQLDREQQLAFARWLLDKGR